MAEKRVQVRMLRATVVDGEVVYPGKMASVSESAARMLVHSRKAELPGEAGKGSTQKKETAAKDPPEDAKQPDPKSKKKES